jgi:hypothetical protein
MPQTNEIVKGKPIAHLPESALKHAEFEKRLKKLKREFRAHNTTAMRRESLGAQIKALEGAIERREYAR